MALATTPSLNLCMGGTCPWDHSPYKYLYPENMRLSQYKVLAAGVPEIRRHVSEQLNL